MFKNINFKKIIPVLVIFLLFAKNSSASLYGLFGEQESGGVEENSSGGSSGSYPLNNATTTPSNETFNLPEKKTTNLLYKFEKNLWFGQKDIDVKRLQEFLNSTEFGVAKTGPGSVGFETEYFGPLTFAALVKFQEAYRAQILTPLGLTKGTGFFGPMTRAYINSL